MRPGFHGNHDRRSIGGGYDEILSSFKYVSMDGDSYEAPKGFTTDGASTHMAFGHLNLFPTPAQHGPQASLHDIHYRTGFVWKDGLRLRSITRKEADRIFSESLELQNMYLPAWYGYWGLRIFGWLVWRKYRRWSGITQNENRD